MTSKQAQAQCSHQMKKEAVHRSTDIQAKRETSTSKQTFTSKHLQAQLIENRDFKCSPSSMTSSHQK